MFVCEISIIIFICGKLRLVGPVQQKIKLSSPNKSKMRYIYVGSTTDTFRYHWNNYKDNNRKAEEGVEHMQADLFEHFASNGDNGFLEDCIITLIDKTDGADSTRRQEYWRRVLETVSPYGLNTAG